MAKDKYLTAPQRAQASRQYRKMAFVLNQQVAGGLGRQLGIEPQLKQAEALLRRASFIAQEGAKIVGHLEESV